MPDEEFRRRLDEFCDTLGETRDEVLNIKADMKSHAKDHMEIDRRLKFHEQTLYTGDQRAPGLVEQALYCRQARDDAKEEAKQTKDDKQKIVMGWQGWLMLAVTLIMALATVVMAIHH